MANAPIQRFNLSRIMKDAWSEYRFQLRGGVVSKSRELWSKVLKSAWRQERDRMARNVEAERLETLRVTDTYAYRVEILENDLENLKYCDGPIARREAVLREQIRTLKAELTASPELEMAA